MQDNSYFSLQKLGKILEQLGRKGEDDEDPEKDGVLARVAIQREGGNHNETDYFQGIEQIGDVQVDFVKPVVEIPVQKIFFT